MEPSLPSPSPFEDPIVPIGYVAPYASSTSQSRTSSSRGSSSAVSSGLTPVAQRYFHSRRQPKGTVEKPWLSRKDPKEKWVTIIPCVGILVGVCIVAYLIYQGVSSVVTHKYCPVLDDDFSNGFNTATWAREVEVGGYGNGQFEYTTNTDTNSYVSDGKLYIIPTVQNASLIENDYTLNLTAMGICTSIVEKDCFAATNTTNGTIINPVNSARINTKLSASISYGRVEVVARLPKGKWLWPAIWMLPVDSVYGEWPLSGEIDIIESRGNGHTYPQGGNNVVSSTLHFGPDASHDAWYKTNVKRTALHTTYASGFHTFGLEWSEKYLFTYVDSRLLQVSYTSFKKGTSLWDRGDFPLASVNNSLYEDPWSFTGRPSTPFDQKFYLIMNVAVGGTNGWFADGVDDKPWIDGSGQAREQFWKDRADWSKDWAGSTDQAMVVDSVKMWQQCD